MKRRKVYYAVLNMGLGHASRSLPLIQEFIRRNWDVKIGSNGRALYFLRRELPKLPFVETPDYRIRYGRNGFLLRGLVSQVPVILHKIQEEHLLCDRIVKEYSPDLIVSDHCYGMYHPAIPSIFLSHQIQFAVPEKLKRFRAIPAFFNLFFHRHYTRVFIPDIDNQGHGLISGKLSQRQGRKDRYAYIGILSSLRKMDLEQDIDLLVSISGPEPQREILERIILHQVLPIKGKTVVVVGKSEERRLLHQSKNLTVYSHLLRGELEVLFNRARLVVTRAGYSTMMELSELGKRALLLPTPGQTEQQFLAQRAMDKQWFYSVSQKQLNLIRDVDTARRYAGLSLPGATRLTVRSFWKNVLAMLG